MSYDPGIASRIPSSAATNNATVAKASPGTLAGFDVFNTNAAARYLKFYDKATTPAPATDVPVLTFYLGPTAPRTVFGIDFKFLVGIGYALVTGAADADNTAVGAGELTGLNVVVS